MNLALVARQVEQDYDRLCERLGLKPVALDIYEVSAEGTLSSFGIDMANSTPGYGPRGIVIPFESGDLAVLGEAPSFPPTIWDRHHPEWPQWRTELWHEVCHQIQDQNLRRWDPSDGKGGHCAGWDDAISCVSSAFQIPAETLRRVL